MLACEFMRSGGRRSFRPDGVGLAADDQADQESKSESTKDALSWILAHVFLSRDMHFLGLDACVLPLFAGAFFQVACGVGRGTFEGGGFFAGDGLELGGAFSGGFAEVLCRFHGALSEDCSFFFCRVCEVAGFLGRPVYLELTVRVAPGWRESPERLREFGYYSDLYV